MTRLPFLGLCLAAAPLWAATGDAYEVCKLDPQGDNFLALRDLPTVDSHMVDKLGPGTLLTASGEVIDGKWLPVVVETGGTGLLPYGYVYTGFVCPL